MGESEGSLDPVDGVAEVWLGEMETGAAVNGLAEMGGCTVGEDAGAVAGEHCAAPDQCSDGIMRRYAGSLVGRMGLLTTWRM